MVEKRKVVYGMLRNPPTNGKEHDPRMHPDVCPMCGKQVWKTSLADNIAKCGGRVLCAKCAMSVAWGEE